MSGMEKPGAERCKEGVVPQVNGLEQLDEQVSFVNVEGFPNTFRPLSVSIRLSRKDHCT